MKYLAFVFIILFTLFTLAQLNDPDPYIWVPFYLVPAAISYAVYRGRYPLLAILPLALLYLGFSLYTFPPSLSAWISDELSNQSMSMKTVSMEEARESLGSMICFAALGIYAFYYYSVKKRGSSNKSDGKPLIKHRG